MGVFSCCCCCERIGGDTVRRVGFRGLWSVFCITSPLSLRRGIRGEASPELLLLLGLNGEVWNALEDGEFGDL